MKQLRDTSEVMIFLLFSIQVIQVHRIHAVEAFEIFHGNIRNSASEKHNNLLNFKRATEQRIFLSFKTNRGDRS